MHMYNEMLSTNISVYLTLCIWTLCESVIILYRKIILCDKTDRRYWLMSIVNRQSEMVLHCTTIRE